jgi:hypothetical protein
VKRVFSWQVCVWICAQHLCSERAVLFLSCVAVLQAALQGFTAVFAVFIVPKVDMSSILLDDSQDIVDEFMREHFNKKQ